MDEVPVTGEIVAAPVADMRYEDEDPDAVARVLVRVEYTDGRIREYEAKEPQDFQMNDPESMSSMVFRKTRLSLAAGGGFCPALGGGVIAALVIHGPSAPQPAHTDRADG